jgi:hypothetical protein
MAARQAAERRKGSATENIVTEASLPRQLLNEGVSRHQSAIAAIFLSPLLRAAYDESRPELQDLWGKANRGGQDPNRSGGLRLSFINALKQFDPLDALVLKARYEGPGELSPNT